MWNACLLVSLLLCGHCASAEDASLSVLHDLAGYRCEAYVARPSSSSALPCVPLGFAAQTSLPVDLSKSLWRVSCRMDNEEREGFLSAALATSAEPLLTSDIAQQRVVTLEAYSDGNPTVPSEQELLAAVHPKLVHGRT